MNGIAGVAARMAEIESAVAALRPPAQAPASGGVGAVPGSQSASGAAFAGALAQALTAGTTPAGAASAAAYGAPTGAAAPSPAAAQRPVSGPARSGKLNAHGIPTDLATYGNGRIPARALSPITGSRHRLWAPAASSFNALLEAAHRDGVRVGITDSYRSYAAQVDLVRRKGLYSRGGLAARPGTSDHGWGMAVDLDLNRRAQAWMRANAGRFGFVEDTPREPWHWGFKVK